MENFVKIIYLALKIDNWEYEILFPIYLEFVVKFDLVKKAQVVDHEFIAQKHRKVFHLLLSQKKMRKNGA